MNNIDTDSCFSLSYAIPAFSNMALSDPGIEFSSTSLTTNPSNLVNDISGISSSNAPLATN